MCMVVHTCTYALASMLMCTFLHSHACVHLNVHVWVMYTGVYMRVCACVCICVCVCRCELVHAYMGVHIFPYVDIIARILFSS